MVPDKDGEVEGAGSGCHAAQHPRVDGERESLVANDPPKPNHLDIGSFGRAGEDTSIGRQAGAPTDNAPANALSGTRETWYPIHTARDSRLREEKDRAQEERENLWGEWSAETPQTLC
jgi:hypothetical protein